MSDEKPGVGDSLAAAARKSGFGALAQSGSLDGRALLGALGGTRGVLESVLPGLVFIVVYTVMILTPAKPAAFAAALGASVAIAAVFTIWRLVTRQNPAQAVAGLVVLGISAILAIVTGRETNNFLPGLVIDAAYGAAVLVSILVRWPLVGFIAGYLMGDGVAWKTDAAKRRLLTIATWAWLALFVIRLAVKVPLYLADQLAPLAVAHLLLGVPLYVLALLGTWLLVRAAYPRRADADAA